MSLVVADYYKLYFEKIEIRLGRNRVSIDQLSGIFETHKITRNFEREKEMIVASLAVKLTGD